MNIISFDRPLWAQPRFWVAQLVVWPAQIGLMWLGLWTDSPDLVAALFPQQMLVELGLSLAGSTLLGSVYLRLPLRLRRGVRGLVTVTLGSLATSVVWGIGRFVHLHWFFAGELGVWVIIDTLDEAIRLLAWSSVFLFVVEGQQLRRLLRQQDEAQTAARDATLRKLVSRIDPAHTENALQSVIAAVGRDPRQAEDLLLDFADLMRRTLRAVRTPRAPLGEVLDLGAALLAYEGRRRDGRLHHRVTSVGALRDVVVPGLLLQPVLGVAVGAAHPIEITTDHTPRGATVAVRHGGRVDAPAMRRAEGDVLAQLRLLYPRSATVGSRCEGDVTVTTIEFDPSELEPASASDEHVENESEGRAAPMPTFVSRAQRPELEEAAYPLTAVVTFSVLLIREWLYYSHHDKQGPIDHFLLVYVLAFALAALIAFVTVAVVRRYARAWVSRGVAVLATLALSVTGCLPWSWVMYRAYDASGFFANQLSEDEVAKLLFIGSALLTTWTTLLSGQHLRRLGNDAYRRILEQESLAKDARLRALQDQTRPHFLFNALNSVVPMIEQAPELAQRMLEDVRVLFGMLLGQSGPVATLREEMSFVSRYLRCEATRYGDYLRVRVDLPPSLEEVPVPRFLLQPLIENAVKHGMSAGPSVLTIAVRARAENGHVRLEVRNDGSLASQAAHGTGTGLRIVEERLANAFARSGSLQLTEEGGWVVAEVAYDPREVLVAERRPGATREASVKLALEEHASLLGGR